MPPRTFGEPTVDVPYLSLFRNTNFTLPSIYPFPTVTPSIQDNPFDVQSEFGISNGFKNPAFQRGFQPEDAQLKLGPIYIRFPRDAGRLVIHG